VANEVSRAVTFVVSPTTTTNSTSNGCRSPEDQRESRRVAEGLPDGLTVERNRDLQGRAGHAWYRRALLCMIAALPVLALLNVFGQRPTVSSAGAAAADLKVTAPDRLRSGLIFQVRVEVLAHRQIANPQLVFDRGWWESMSVNSLEPNPTDESSNDGRVVLSYNTLSAGKTLVVWLYFQVNPTNVGKRTEDVALEDGSNMITRVHRSLTIFP
jgi:hypothetical protein